MDQDRSCYKCGFFGTTAETVCPQCRSRLFTFTNTRVRGALLVAIGLGLVVFMAYILMWALTAFQNSAPGGSRFTGTERDKVMIIVLFVVLIIFGMFSIVTGGWQIVLGRRSKILSRVMLGVGALIGVIVGAVLYFM